MTVYLRPEDHISSGDLDRLVTPQQRVLTKDPVYKGTVETWVNLPERWAKVVESATAGEAVGKDGVSTYARPHNVTMWWCADVNTECRLVLDDGRILQINGAAQLGRQKWLKLSCTEWEHQQL